MTAAAYPAQHVYTHDRDLFLRALFVPPAQREPVLALYALVVELEKIPHDVTEEMIGHIKYAWWEEALSSFATDNATKGHPVLEALEPLTIDRQQLIETVLQYRNSYPEPLPDRHCVLHALTSRATQDTKRWKKADAIINFHYSKYGKKYRSWLMVKLLFV